MAVKNQNSGENKNKNKNKNNMSKKSGGLGTALAVGAGAVAALATGYFLYGPKGAQHRKQVRAWTVKAKGEVLHELERMKDVSKEKYDATIDKVTDRYSKLKDISSDEALKLNREMKKYWKEIKSEAGEGVQDGKKKVNSLRKKIGKQAGKKAGKKKSAKKSA